MTPEKLKELRDHIEGAKKWAEDIRAYSNAITVLALAGSIISECESAEQTLTEAGVV